MIRSVISYTHKLENIILSCSDAISNLPLIIDPRMTSNNNNKTKNNPNLESQIRRSALKIAKIRALVRAKNASKDTTNQ